MNTHVGHVFGAYRLTTLLERNAYTEAYLGEHTRVQRQAVIKLLTLPLPEGGWTAFQQICTKASGLVHPGIVPMLDFDQQEGTVFLVQEYLPNGSLGQHCPPGAHVPLQQVAGWVQRIADALSYAHGQQVLHLGLAPSNLLFNQQQEVVVSDFGLAAFVRSLLPAQVSMSAESVTYLAPEQLQGQAGPASDQYALAICAYEWLRGALPFQGEPSAIIAGHLASPPPSLRPHLPDLPVEVEQVVLTALRKQPAERFGSIQAFAQAFSRAGNLENKLPVFMPAVPAPPSVSGSQVPPTAVSPTQPARAVPPVPAAPGSPVPGAAPISSPTPPPPIWPQTPSGPEQMALPPYPQPSQPASASPHISRRAAIMGAVGVGAAGVLTTLCTRTAWLSFLVKSLSSRGASAEATPTVAPNRLLYTYRGHKKSPVSLLWSSDSTRLISIELSSSLSSSGEFSGSIHVWDALTGEHASIFDAPAIVDSYTPNNFGLGVAWTASGPCLGWIDHTQPPGVHITNLVSKREISAYSAAANANDHFQGARLMWSPNGKYLAVGTEEHIVVLEAVSGKAIATFPLPSDATSTDYLIWSPNSQYLAVIAEYTASVWEISSGEQLSTYQEVKELVWSSDSANLATIGFGSQSDIWTAQGGRQLYTYTNLPVGTGLIGWSVDNSLFATDSIDSGKTLVWNANTHQLLQTLQTSVESGSNSIWAPDSSRLAAPGMATFPDGVSYVGDVLTVWDAVTGQQLTSHFSQENDAEENGTSPGSIAWSPNGKYIAGTFTSDNGVYVWSAP